MYRSCTARREELGRNCISALKVESVIGRRRRSASLRGFDWRLRQYRNRIEGINDPLPRVISSGPGRTAVENYVATLLSAMCKQYPQANLTLVSRTTVAFAIMPNVIVDAAPSPLRWPFWHNHRTGSNARPELVQAFWGSEGIFHRTGFGNWDGCAVNDLEGCSCVRRAVLFLR